MAEAKLGLGYKLALGAGGTAVAAGLIVAGMQPPRVDRYSDWIPVTDPNKRELDLSRCGVSGWPENKEGKAVRAKLTTWDKVKEENPSAKISGALSSSARVALNGLNFNLPVEISGADLDLARVDRQAKNGGQLLIPSSEAVRDHGANWDYQFSQKGHLTIDEGITFSDRNSPMRVKILFNDNGTATQVVGQYFPPSALNPVCFSAAVTDLNISRETLDLVMGKHRQAVEKATLYAKTAEPRATKRSQEATVAAMAQAARELSAANYRLATPVIIAEKLPTPRPTSRSERTNVELGVDQNQSPIERPLSVGASFLGGVGGFLNQARKVVDGMDGRLKVIGIFVGALGAFYFGTRFSGSKN